MPQQVCVKTISTTCKSCYAGELWDCLQAGCQAAAAGGHVVGSGAPHAANAARIGAVLAFLRPIHLPQLRHSCERYSAQALQTALERGGPRRRSLALPADPRAPYLLAFNFPT